MEVYLYVKSERVVHPVWFPSPKSYQYWSIWQSSYESAPMNVIVWFGAASIMSVHRTAVGAVLL